MARRRTRRTREEMDRDETRSTRRDDDRRQERPMDRSTASSIRKRFGAALEVDVPSSVESVVEEIGALIETRREEYQTQADRLTALLKSIKSI